jgi:pyridoxamine 5'-phosphate oxidase
MASNKKTFWTETLPEPLPHNPLLLARDWLHDATQQALQPNPNAMVLATVDAHGQPSARVVLCKAIEPEPGSVLFYTNYASRKGAELAANPKAALVFHWDHLHRQIRIEGEVRALGEADNDAYFAGRPWQSRLGAWASQQSQPVASRADLAEAVAAQARRFGIAYAGPGSAEPENVTVEVPRPPNWGGFRLTARAVEVWVEGEFRIHDRARWCRAAGAPWHVTRLQP